MKVFIPWRFPSLNDVIAKTRANRYSGARQKKKLTTKVAKYTMGLPPLENGPYLWCFEWHEQNRRRDPDNIASAVKFIFDGLKQSGVIANDGWAVVGVIEHRFVVDAKCGVLVETFELDNCHPER